MRGEHALNGNRQEALRGVGAECRSDIAQAEAAVGIVEIADGISGVAPPCDIAAVHAGRFGEGVAAGFTEAVQRREQPVHYADISDVETHCPLRLAARAGQGLGVGRHVLLGSS